MPTPADQAGAAPDSAPTVPESLRAPTHIASVTLAARDAPALAAFYERVIGLKPRADASGLIRLHADDGPALVEIEPALAARPRPPGSAGLFHTAFLLPTRRDLALWLRHALALGLVLEGASDHRVSEAIYLSDPEGNGIEIYADQPREAWPRDGAGVAMATLPLDLPALLAEAGAEPPGWRFPANGVIGHVHLSVGDLALAETGYRGTLGMDAMARYPGAAFLSWGGYHHHIALNVWRSRGAGPVDGRDAGLRAVTLAGLAPGPLAAGPWRDPSGIELRHQASASISSS